MTMHSKPIFSRPQRWLAAMPLFCFFLAGNATAAPLAMKLAPELQGVEPQAVQGRKSGLWQAEVQFGDWRTTAPAPFDAQTWTWEAILPESRANEALRVDVHHLGFDFELRSATGSGSIFNQCMAQGRFAVHEEFRGRVTDETSVALPGYPRIDCKLAGPQPGQLSLRPDFLTQRESGLARFGARSWNVQSVNNLATQRSSFPLGRFGYEFRAGGDVVAAVETAGIGRVWFHPSLNATEREELTAVMTTLLYYSVLLEEQDS
jgi:hypothetical protein